jgi:hypothetical protein
MISIADGQIDDRKFLSFAKAGWSVFRPETVALAARAWQA